MHGETEKFGMTMFCQSSSFSNTTVVLFILRAAIHAYEVSSDDQKGSYVT